MNFWTNVNWETVLVVGIPGLLTLLGVLYNDFRKKKNAKIDSDSAVVLKREPTWVELEEANRALRTELDAQRKEFEGKMAALTDRMNRYEEKTNRRIGALSNMLHATAYQWPADHAGPFFDAEDFSALEMTDIPYTFRNRVRPKAQ